MAKKDKVGKCRFAKDFVAMDKLTG